jgi:hypothetical protein
MRNLDSTLAAHLNDGLIQPVIMAMLTFRTQTTYVWSGVGTLTYGGNNYLGVGSMGKLGVITEGVDVQADGVTVELSGIDPIYKGECLTDIQVGAPAKIWFGLLSANALVGAPYLVFSGTVDKPTFSIGGDSVTISLALENKMLNLSRASQRRYTSADQHIQYPDDTAFGWVEQLSDQALIWGA